MRRIIASIKDHPLIVTVVIIILVSLHFLLTTTGTIPDFLKGIEKSPDANGLYTGMLEVAALQASFAGVIVVFGLSTQPRAFRILRLEAGSALVDNWLSISQSGFESAGYALLATILNMSGLSWIASFAFEASILFCLHGVIRLLWLLRCMIKVIQNNDVKESQEEHKLR